MSWHACSSNLSPIPTQSTRESAVMFSSMGCEWGGILYLHGESRFALVLKVGWREE
jgi:hypothetical protein